MHHHLDPAPPGDKALEMVLFLVVGLLTGWLVQRQRAALEQRRSAEARAERLESLVGLTSGLAHEVRNPLASIQGSLEILADDHAPGSEKREIAEVGLREAARLDGVLRDFIGFARPTEPQPVEVDLGALATRVVDAARLAHAVGFELYAPHRVVVRADPEQLERCVGNLVKNAAEWSPEGASVEVSVHAEPPRIDVEDRGPGVAVEDRERIFDPYFTKRQGGTGLGLAIAGQVARANGAALMYAPRIGGGSRFRLEFEPGDPAT